jgi:hypothetical protein
MNFAAEAEAVKKRGKTDTSRTKSIKRAKS